MNINISNDLELLKDNFEQNISSVDTLLNFDRFILDFSIEHLETLNKRLKENHGIENPKLTVNNTLQMLKNIKENGSISKQYQTIYNQALVLLVSYYTSTLKEIFSKSIFPFISKFDELKILNEEIKITVEQLKKTDFDLSSQISELIILKKGYSFQDMQSTVKALKECFDFDYERDNHINNIILGQASRHAIVHNISIIDQQLINQIKTAFPRDVKKEINEKYLSFSPEEVLIIADSMKTYIYKIITWINRKYNE